MSSQEDVPGVNRKNYLVVTLLLVLCGVIYLILSGLTPPENPRSLRMIVGGDVFVGDRLLEDLRRKGAGYYTEDVADITEQADLHLANLEAPVTARDTTPVRKQYLLRSHPSGAREVLGQLNVDGVSLANNHVLDYEAQGLLDTMRNLNDFGIRYTGAGANREWASRPVYFERQGHTVGFLGFSNTYPRSFWASESQPGSAYGDPELITRRVEETARQSEVTVVSFHWGSELDTRPQGYQKRLARRAVRAGADVVFGHHPHSIQPYERYRDGVIFYSLGNYFFTTMSRDVDHGLLADVTFTEGELDRIRFHVLNINNYRVDYRPRVELSFKNGRRLARFFDRPNFTKVALATE
jgi:poly-gamma-glutamate capsule biosynthesis protein CapA/YwtB (metallophosphatase superfamily)